MGSSYYSVTVRRLVRQSAEITAKQPGIFGFCETNTKSYKTLLSCLTVKAFAPCHWTFKLLGLAVKSPPIRVL